MIFVTVGTHNQGFERLIRQIDNIAPQLNEKVIIQRGYTKYIPKNCKSFEWAPSLHPYLKNARLVVTHASMALIEIINIYKKPVIAVPRQYKFREHINDHQIEFAESAEKKLGIKVILDISELNPKLLENYTEISRIDPTNLKKLQEFLRKNLERWEK